MTTLFENVQRLFLFDAPKYVLPSEKPELADDSEFVLELEHQLGRSETGPIFVLGRFGAGKTAHLLKFRESFETKYSFAYQSFFAVNDLPTAYLRLVPFLDRTVALSFFTLSLLLLFIFVSGADPSLFRSLIVIASFGFFEYLFLSNRGRIYFILANALRAPFLKTGRITIIDDLDRSSLQQSDWWALLSNLWTHKTKYIVALGYNTEPERLKFLEIAAKLGGPVIELPVDPFVNQSIARKLDQQFPFEIQSKDDWLAEVTPRELIRIKDQVQRFSIQKPISYRRAVYVHVAFQFLKTNLVRADQRDDVNADTNRKPFGVSFRITNLAVTDRVKILIRDFGQTISGESIALIDKASSSADGQPTSMENKFVEIVQKSPEFWNLNFKPDKI